MLDKIKRLVGSSTLIKKILWTLLIVFVYMTGRALPIATVVVREVDEEMLNALSGLAVVTGGQFSSMTLFSLGLSPWMSSMIIWRFLTLFKYFKSLTMLQTHYYRLSLMFLVGLIQSLGLASANEYVTLPLLGSSSPLVMQLISMFIMIAGAYVLMWLGNINAQRGLGGSTIIILVNLIINFLGNLASFLGQWSNSLIQLVMTGMLFTIIISVLVMISVTIYRAEYRIPIKRINVISKFAESTYIPIRVNPANSLPFMYSMSLMILPPMLMRGLSNLFPNNEILLFLSKNSGLTKLPGISMYILMLFILSIGFAYYNYDVVEISQDMRRNGDYIENIRPGEETRRYISKILNALTLFGAVFTCVWGGMPLLLVMGQSDQVSLALLVNNIFIVTSLMLGIIEQVSILRSWKNYRQLI